MADVKQFPLLPDQTEIFLHQLPPLVKLNIPKSVT